MIFECFDPSATVESLVGNSNDWNPVARPLKRDAGGSRKVMLRLGPGTYHHKFVINGHRWEENPLDLERSPNRHGTFNSIGRIGPLFTDGFATGKDTVNGHEDYGRRV